MNQHTIIEEKKFSPTHFTRCDPVRCTWSSKELHIFFSRPFHNYQQPRISVRGKFEFLDHASCTFFLS
jgi:hypothetical protein